MVERAKPDDKKVGFRQYFSLKPTREEKEKEELERGRAGDTFEAKAKGAKDGRLEQREHAMFSASELQVHLGALEQSISDGMPGPGGLEGPALAYAWYETKMAERQAKREEFFEGDDRRRVIERQLRQLEAVQNGDVTLSELLKSEAESIRNEIIEGRGRIGERRLSPERIGEINRVADNWQALAHSITDESRPTLE